MVDDLSKMILRPMSEADIPAVVAIEQQVQYAPWSAQLFREGLERGHVCMVAEWQQRIVGFSVVQYILDEAHLLDIAVNPADQGQGIGGKLLTQLMQHAEERQASMMFLEVRVSNQRAIHLYQQAGFNEMGIRKNYYPTSEGKEHALMMAFNWSF